MLTSSARFSNNWKKRKSWVKSHWYQYTKKLKERTKEKKKIIIIIIRRRNETVSLHKTSVKTLANILESEFITANNLNIF